MPSYTVRWEIDIEADAPLEAAKEAHRSILEYPEAKWTWEVSEDNDEWETVDMEEVDA